MILGSGNWGVVSPLDSNFINMRMSQVEPRALISKNFIMPIEYSPEQH